MNFSNFFISRPIFATVLAIIVTLVGVMSMRILPIEQYPSVAPPTVSVQAQFPGRTLKPLRKRWRLPSPKPLTALRTCFI